MRRLCLAGAVMALLVLVPGRAEGRTPAADEPPENWLGQPGVTPADGPSPEGPAPTLTVTPDIDLVDGQVVEVSGSGWTPDGEIFLLQCQEGMPTTDPDACAVSFQPPVIADGSGNFETTYRVRAIPSPFFNPFDCREITCNLTAVGFPDGSQVSTVLHFAPDGPLVPAPVMTVTPNEDLAEIHTVRVDITGFFPGDQIAIAECIDAADGEVECSGAFEARTADANGEVHTTFEVRRTFGGLFDDPIDCLESQCFVATGSILDEQPTARVNLSFSRPAAPAEPTIVVTPAFTG